jgi:superfamily II DNA helicase RecQ
MFDSFPFLKSQEKGIVFVDAKSKIAHVKAALQNLNVLPSKIFIYHGDLEQNLKDQYQEEWTNGTSTVMIATTAFSLGIDYKSVRYVFVLGCYGLDDLIQMFGRAGRDNEVSFCHYYPQPAEYLKKDNQEQALLKKLEADKQCIR